MYGGFGVNCCQCGFFYIGKYKYRYYLVGQWKMNFRIWVVICLWDIEKFFFNVFGGIEFDEQFYFQKLYGR